MRPLSRAMSRTAAALCAFALLAACTAPAEPDPSGPAATVGPADRIEIVVVGDTVTAGDAGYGLLGTPAAWPEQLRTLLESEGYEVQILVDAVPGSGFAIGGSDRFADRLGPLLSEAEPDLVVLLGGVDDEAPAEVVDAGVLDAIGAVRSDPDGPALLLVVPMVGRGAPGPRLEAITASLERRAAEYGVPLIDPTRDLPVAGGRAPSADARLLTDDQHAALAAALLPAVRQLAGS